MPSLSVYDATILKIGNKKIAIIYFAENSLLSILGEPVSPLVSRSGITITSIA